MSKIYISCAKRTAVGSFGGSLSTLSPSDFGSEVIKSILNETKINPDEIEEIISGNILPAGQGQSLGRQLAIKSNMPITTPGYTLNIACGSGLKAIVNSYSVIKSDTANVIIAGGTESMSQAPYLLPKDIRNGIKMGNFEVIDHMIYDALTDYYGKYHMGITAENIAEKLNITRKEQDEFAFHSQSKAKLALDKNLFENEIVDIKVQNKKETIVFNKDEYPRLTSLEKLSTLKPAFKKDGTVTAANSSGLNDGAAFVLVSNESIVEKYNLTPMVEIIAFAQSGVDPSIMGLGPVHAIKKALLKANLKLQDIDLLEINEAFAAQTIGVIRELEKEHNMSYKEILEKTNVNGGAIAFGHPVGASGAKITVNLIHEMKRAQKKYGLSSLCIGGGMGIACIFKLI